MLIVVWRVPGLFSSIGGLLVNLSFEDLITGICLSFRIIVISVTSYFIFTVICFLSLYSFALYNRVSLVIIPFIAIDRYILVYHSASHKRLHTPKASFILTFIVPYIVAIATTSPLLKDYWQKSKTCQLFSRIKHKMVFVLCTSIWMVILLCFFLLLQDAQLS